MRSNPNAALIVIPIVLAYLAILATIIYFATRAAKRRMQAQSDGFAESLTVSGARRIGEGPAGGPYKGREVELELDGQRVFVNAYYINRYYIRANLRIAVPWPLPWTAIYPEGKVERFGKAIGLNREVQTGDQEFDDLAYIDTIERDEVVRPLFESAAVRTTIRALLQLGYKVELTPTGVSAYQLVSGSKKVRVDGSQTPRAVRLLTELVAALPSLGGATFTATPQTRVVLPMLAPLLLMAPMIGVMALASRAIDSTFDYGSKMAFFVFGGGVWVIYSVILALLLRGRSYSFRLWMIGSFIGLFPVPMIVGGILLHLNRELDKSECAYPESTIVGKHTYKSSRYIYVAPWTEGGNRVKFYIKRESYERVKAGDAIVLDVHPGAFGWEWGTIKRIPVIDDARTPPPN